MDTTPDNATEARRWLNQALSGLNVRFNPEGVSVDRSLALAGIYAQLAVLDGQARACTTDITEETPNA